MHYIGMTVLVPLFPLFSTACYNDQNREFTNDVFHTARQVVTLPHDISGLVTTTLYVLNRPVCLSV